MRTASALFRIGLLVCGAAAAGSAAADGALRLPITERTRMVYEPRPWSAATLPPAEAARAPAKANLGLEFATVSKTRDVKSLLRVQLSADSALNFRPRGGGLTVTYRSTF